VAFPTNLPGMIRFRPFCSITAALGSAAAKAIEALGSLFFEPRTVFQPPNGADKDSANPSEPGLQIQDFLSAKRIASFGNSFGRIAALLGAQQASYCAAVYASGSAESGGSRPRFSNS